MKNFLQSCAFALAILAAFGSQSFAGIIQGEFAEFLDLPSVTGGPRILFTQADVGPVFRLTEPDFTEVTNPNNLAGYFQIDLTGNILTLTNVGLTDFQLVSVEISKIMFSTDGQFISAVTLVGPSIISTSVLPASPSIETVTSTGNSIKISWSVEDPYTSPDTFSFVAGGTATYEITFGTANTVPEPGTMSIFGIGAIAMLLRARRQSRG